MKKYIILGISLLMVSLSLLAGPAYPGRIVVTQPDGTQISIFMHGDEYGHWVTDEQGRILEQGADGFWRVSDHYTVEWLSEMQEEADILRAADNQQRVEYALKAPSTNYHSPYIPVILAGTSDVPFTYQKADFEALMSTQTGSVLEYFTDNSRGQYTPQFVVLGPVNVAGVLADYGGNNSNGKDKAPYALFYNAAKALDADVDFSIFDNDGDGNVDVIMFCFAGYDEAQGGGENCIWSHASSFTGRYSPDDLTLDGVKLGRYFCSAELIGRSGGNMCHIGTICHELSHTLGLPDFYDTDYETNGSAASMYEFDLMSGGNYNDDGLTPPYYTAEELVLVGWMSDIPILTGTGPVSLPAINYPSASAYSACKIETNNPGEYFVLETRGGQKWDAPLPVGLMVYHVDKSSNIVVGSQTASYLWNNTNKLNAYVNHPCCYVVPAITPLSTEEYNGSLGDFIFPGTGGVVAYEPVAWSGDTFGLQLKDIVYANGVTTFNIVNSNQLGIVGQVTGTDGIPIAGATISVSPVGNPQTSSIHRRSFTSVTTDANGYYSIDLSAAGNYLVIASKEGYQEQSSTVSVSRLTTLNFWLLRNGEQAPEELILYPSGSEFHNYTTNSSIEEWDKLYANFYSVSFLRPYAGKHIKSISFGAGGTAITDCHVFIDFDSERQFALPVDSQDVNLNSWTTVDVSDLDLFVPQGVGMYVGFGGHFTGTHPFWGTPVSGEKSYFSDFSPSTIQTAGSWGYFTGLVFAIKISIGDYIAPDTGYSYIADPLLGAYNAGDPFNLTLVETAGDRKPGTPISWYLDDEPVSGSSVTLTAGPHLIEARFTTMEGKTKVVELELDVAP